MSAGWEGIYVVRDVPGRRPHRCVACPATFATREALIEHTEWPSTLRQRRAHVDFIERRCLVNL
jgi:hypothetical protein